MTDLELYYLLQALMKDEEKSVDSYHTRDFEMKEILEVRKQQTENPLLKFSIFDPLRNDSARKLRLQRVRHNRLHTIKAKKHWNHFVWQFEQMKTRELLAKNQQADFLAPYLVRFEDKKPQKEEIDVAVRDCLKDFKKNYADIENELQRRYDESTTEMNSLKRFLHRYLDQFTIQEYEKFIQEGWVWDGNSASSISNEYLKKTLITARISNAIAKLFSSGLSPWRKKRIGNMEI